MDIIIDCCVKVSVKVSLEGFEKNKQKVDVIFT